MKVFGVDLLRQYLLKVDLNFSRGRKWNESFCTSRSVKTVGWVKVFTEKESKMKDKGKMKRGKQKKRKNWKKWKMSKIYMSGGLKLERKGEKKESQIYQEKLKRVKI